MSSWPSPGEGAAAPATPGRVLGGRYALASPIASGGMAQVWSGTDELLGRPVAIKILHPHLATDDGFVERFRREAVAAASLSHRTIVSVYDTISADGVEAIVMELIEGRTLRAVLDEIGTMPISDVIHLGVQIASALDVAHAAGIVHRDIKPANIMISSGRRVKVTDFGIAKAGTDADLTATGTLLGTAKYLSPEQVTGAPLDPRSDLYALGVVLYEAVAGTVPFKSNTDAATALARLHQEPPPLVHHRPDVPPALASVIARAMAREPDWRYGRARDIRDALAALVPGGVGDVLGDEAPPPADPLRPMPPTPPAGRPGTGRDGDRRMPPHPSTVSNAAWVQMPDHSLGYPVVRSDGEERGGSRRASGPLVDGSAGGPPDGSGGHDGTTVGPAAWGAALSATTLRRSLWTRIIPALLIVVAALAAAILLSGLGGPDGVDGSETPTVEAAATTEPADANPLDESGSGLTIVEVTSFDPESSDPGRDEREDLVGNAVDGDPSTAWHTETYRRGGLGGLKSGVGLILTVEESVPLNRLELATDTRGWSAEVYVGDEFGDDPSTWGAPVATVNGGRRDVTLELDRTEGRKVLLWLTDTGQSEGRFRFELSEVVIR